MLFLFIRALLFVWAMPFVAFYTHLEFAKVLVGILIEPPIKQQIVGFEMFLLLQKRYYCIIFVREVEIFFP